MRRIGARERRRKRRGLRSTLEATEALRRASAAKNGGGAVKTSNNPLAWSLAQHCLRRLTTISKPLPPMLPSTLPPTLLPNLLFLFLNPNPSKPKFKPRRELYHPHLLPTSFPSHSRPSWTHSTLRPQPNSSHQPSFFQGQHLPFPRP